MLLRPGVRACPCGARERESIVHRYRRRHDGGFVAPVSDVLLAQEQQGFDWPKGGGRVDCVSIGPSRFAYDDRARCPICVSASGGGEECLSASRGATVESGGIV